MNLQSFGKVLNDSFTARNHHVRKEVENHLLYISSQPGFGAMVMDFVTDKQFSFHTRQAAAIRLKNVVNPPKIIETNGEWEKNIHPQDKTVIKNKILQAIDSVEYAIKDILAEILKDIVDVEFPQRWNIVPEIMHYFQQRDNNKLLTGLIALQQLTKSYKAATTPEHRQPLEQIASDFFPILVQLTSSLLDENNHQNFICAMLRSKIMIIYNNVMGTALIPGIVNDPQNQYSMAKIIMEQMNAILRIPVDRQQQQQHGGYNSPMYTEKKYVTYNIYTFVTSFIGYIGNTNEEVIRMKPFGNWWLKNFGPVFLDTHLYLLEQHRKMPLPEFILNKSLYYIDRAIVEPNIFHGFIKPKVRQYFGDILFPFLCFNGEDEDLYQNAPKEYLSFEFMAPKSDDFSVRVAALHCYKTFLLIHRDFCTPEFWSFIKYISEEFLAGRCSPAQKFAVYYLLGNTKDLTWGIVEFRREMPQYILKHVLPDMKHGVPFLKSHAFWIMGIYYDAFVSPEDHRMVTDVTLNSIKDNQLITRCSAGIALASLMQKFDMINYLHPYLGNIVSQFIEMMKTVDAPIIIESFSEIIENNAQQMKPFAMNLLQTIVNNLNIALGEDEDDALDRCINYLQTILNLLRVLAESKNLFLDIEQLIIPLIKRLLLEDEQTNFIEDALSLLTFMTFHAPTLTPFIWSCYPVMFEAYYKFHLRWLFSHMHPPLDNYISNGTEELLSSPRYIDLLMGVLRSFFEDKDVNVYELSSPFMLISSLLQCCKGKLPKSLFFELLDIIVDYFGFIERPKVLKLICCALGDAFAYDSTLVINHLMEKKLLIQVIRKWLDELPQLSKDYERKVAVLGLTSILNNDLVKLPQELKPLICPILHHCVSLLHETHKSRHELENRKRVLEESKEDLLRMFNQNQQQDGNLVNAIQSLLESENRGESNEQLVRLKNSPYFQEVMKTIQPTEEYEDYDEDYDTLLNDDATITTAIDNVNEFFVFAEACFRMSTQYPQIFHQEIMSNLSMDLRQQLHTLLESYCQQNQHLIPILRAVFSNKGNVKLT